MQKIIILLLLFMSIQLNAQFSSITKLENPVTCQQYIASMYCGAVFMSSTSKPYRDIIVPPTTIHYMWMGNGRFIGISVQKEALCLYHFSNYSLKGVQIWEFNKPVITLMVI